MLPVDYVHATLLVGVALYIWGREPPRLLMTPLMLMSFFVLYGAGNVIYFKGAQTIPGVHEAVVTSLVLMWICLIAGIELARICAQPLYARFQQVTRGWRSARIVDRSDGDNLLIGIGIATTLYLIGVFIYLHKPSQLSEFVSLQSVSDKAKYRHDFGAEGGYLYQTLLACVAPFLSFLLLVKGISIRKPTFLWLALIMGAVILAGKVGTFQKSPWVVYLLQLIAVWQLMRGLEFGLGRILILSVVTIAGVVLAVMIALPQIEGADILEWLGYRFFEVNNEGIYQTFYVYPHYLPHTWGMNIGLIHAIFGSGDLVPAYSRVASAFGAQEATFDVVFIGDAWVDFSYGGVIVISLIVGFVVKTLDVFAMNIGKTPVTIALLGSGLYGVFQLQVNSAFTAFLSGGLLIIPLVTLASIALMNDMSRPAGGWDERPTS